MGRKSRFETTHTPIGGWILNYCKSHKISMREMARRLSMTVAYLSGMGTGVNNVPSYFREAIKENCDLDSSEEEALKVALATTDNSSEKKVVGRVCINIYNPSDEVRYLAYQFAQKANTLSRSNREDILKILREI